MVSRTQTYQINKDPAVHGRAHWSEKQRLEAVTTYLMLGKWTLVSSATGIPVDTLKKWKASDWWKDSEEEIRRSSNIELGGKLKRIIDKAASVVEDRLENGELVFNSQTKAFTDRRPVKMKEASEVLHKTIDRNILIEKIQEKPQFKEEAILDRLKSIEEALIRGAKKRYGKEDSSIIDVTIVEPVSIGPVECTGMETEGQLDDLNLGSGSEGYSSVPVHDSEGTTD